MDHAKAREDALTVIGGALVLLPLTQWGMHRYLVPALPPTGDLLPTLGLAALFFNFVLIAGLSTTLMNQLMDRPRPWSLVAAILAAGLLGEMVAGLSLLGLLLWPFPTALVLVALDASCVLIGFYRLARLQSPLLPK